MWSRSSVLCSGVQGSWFVGSSGIAPSLRQSLRMFLVCCAGIASINFFCRGNVWGSCENQSQLTLPSHQLYERRQVPVPEGYDFVGDEVGK